jgi:hypothetical protein
MQSEHLTDPQPRQSKQPDQQPRTLPATAIIATYSSKLPVRGSPSPERGNRLSGPATIGGKSSNHGIASPAGSATSYSSRLTDRHRPSTNLVAVEAANAAHDVLTRRE